MPVDSGVWEALGTSWGLQSPVVKLLTCFLPKSRHACESKFNHSNQDWEGKWVLGKNGLGHFVLLDHSGNRLEFSARYCSKGLRLPPCVIQAARLWSWDSYYLHFTNGGTEALRSKATRPSLHSWKLPAGRLLENSKTQWKFLFSHVSQSCSRELWT